MESILNYQEEELELEITEGVNDSGIFKAIVMAGGPGSGKSYVAKKLGLGTMGLRVINSDSFFELLLKKKGLSLKMPDNEEEEREAARFYAKALTSKRLDDSIRGRLGVLIDSTSGDVKKTSKIIQRLKQVGYDVKVLFVQTTLEVAQKRNQERPRSVPPEALEFSWKGAQKAKSQLKSIVGSRDYHEIDNNHGDKPDMALAGKLTSWSKRLNTRGQQWINHVRNGQTHGVSEENDINTMDSFLEFMSMSQRLQRSRTAKRTAKKRARSALRTKKRFKTPDQLLAKAQKMARDAMGKKLTGGIPIAKLTIPQKMQLAKKLDKKKGAIAKLSKKMMVKAKKAERERIKNIRGQ
ncbi:MAG: hypothetical protein CBE07_003460 [Pelagibacteraceae bacterium TMED247]|nr:MAG: hypothetical protein CBE07_003460 [Pelagibacteraceae bacterium TMED247]